MSFCFCWAASTRAFFLQKKSKKLFKIFHFFVFLIELVVTDGINIIIQSIFKDFCNYYLLVLNAANEQINPKIMNFFAAFKINRPALIIFFNVDHTTVVSFIYF